MCVNVAQRESGCRVSRVRVGVKVRHRKTKTFPLLLESGAVEAKKGASESTTD